LNAIVGHANDEEKITGGNPGLLARHPGGAESV
jgi:hypothetical protein